MFDFRPSFGGILVAVIIGVVSTLLFGGSVPAAFFAGAVRGGIEASGRNFGKGIVEFLQGNHEENSSSSHAVYALPAPGHGGWCGTDPNNSVRCCNDTSYRLTIQYWGPTSPYSGVNGVKFSYGCYRV